MAIGPRFGRRFFLALAAGGADAPGSAAARVRARDRRLELDLVAQETAVAIEGGPASALTENGLLPGPLLEVEPGDTVRIRLHNRLDRPTNLHYHGLHIPPSGNADNVFLSVAPGSAHRYSFTIPADHPASTSITSLTAMAAWPSRCSVGSAAC